MPVRTLFDNLPPGGVSASIMVIVMLAVEGGYRLGKFRRERPGREVMGGHVRNGTAIE